MYAPARGLICNTTIRLELAVPIATFDVVPVICALTTKFKVSELPVETQFSSTNDILVDDINSDGNLDIILAGNLFVSEIETTRNDAGTGAVLLGDGQNGFKALAHLDSGFFARKDAKKLGFVNGGKKKLLLVANNDDQLQVFEVKEQ